MNNSNDNQQKQSGEQDFTSCPDWGKGGHYIVNPETGLRERVTPVDESVPADNAQETETKKVTAKEKSRA